MCRLPHPLVGIDCRGKRNGEICRILIYLRPLAVSDSHSTRYLEVNNFSVVLRVYTSILLYVFYAELLSNCVENFWKTEKVFCLCRYVMYCSHSADLHETQNS
jgi:hypothetical protein